MLDFFTGRSNRQEYWISVVLLIVAALALNYFNMQTASAAVTIMWIITWVRRLHDIGKSGWYAGAPIVVLVVVVLAAFVFGGKDFQNVMAALQADDPKSITESAAALLMAIIAVAAVVQFGFTIWLGVKAGDSGKNKFGPPPEPLVPH